ncbi:MAG: FAD-dependent oxidoreductase [Acetobacteraceae bacterium]|nr:FAD-dependent oxidoreductase [Acetobacteraceae bacterium]
MPARFTQARGYDLPVFPHRRAPEQDGARTRHPVAVVGGGLTGLTAACDLALRGVPVVLLDEDDTVGVRGASSRGICYAERSLDMLDRFGVYGRVTGKGVTWSVGRVLVDDDEVYSFDLAQGSASRRPPFINIQQFYVEWFLVDRLRELPPADLRWKNRVVGAREEADHVALEVETPEGPYTLRADWVIDASGLASGVRAALGVQTRSAQSVDRWCISDVRFAKPVPPERWTWVRAAFNEGRAVWQHQMADGVWRIDYQMSPDASPEEISRPETVERRLRAHLGEDVDLELVWVGPWGYRTHLLDDFRHGRVFFAGDAAHVFSPFGARGGNSGMQDAENISWKLAAVLGGHTGDALLDSYGAERRTAAAFNIMTTERSARFLAPRSPFEHALREAVLDLAREHPFARRVVNMGRMSVAHDYAGSPLTTNAGQALPNVVVRLPDGQPGAVSDLLRGEGTRFLVLAGRDAEVPADVSPLARVYATDPDAAGGHPVIAGERLGAMIRPGEVLVVRPDQHLAARFSRPRPAEIAAAIDRALGKGVQA